MNKGLMTSLCSLLFLFLATSLVSSQEAATANLEVSIASSGGFGCKSNLYSWSMETFKGDLYVGTNNNRGGAFGLRFFIAGLPLRIFTAGGQVHKGTRNSVTGDWSWTRVLEDGLNDKNNYGIRKMKAVGDWLYGVTGNHSNGCLVIKTTDGTNWEPASLPGFGKTRNTSGRGLAAYKGYLYVGTENRFQGAEIWRRAIDSNGEFVGNDDENDWELVVEKGVDERKNIWFSDFEVFNDGTDEYLYAGTFNTRGANLWRTVDGTTWTNVFSEGGGNSNDEAIMKIAVYEGLMYLGTSNISDGATLLVSSDSTATSFQPIITGGAGNTDNTFVWYITPYAGRLYVSYLHSGLNNEFALYSSDTPEVIDSYVTETTDSFGLVEDTIGLRSMVVHDGKLMMGTAAGAVPTVVFEGTSRNTTTRLF